ncbi:MAG: hypothetical protein AAB405_02270 [Patescibacteria group bacterium]
MDYSLITEQQAQKKYNSLPDKIRNVLDSENSVMTVGQICRKHHLDDERILIVNQLVALILLGFVSPNDFSQEIMDNTHLNYQHSDDIAKEIYEKIFAPIRSEIDKIYSPVPPIASLVKKEMPAAEIKEKEILKITEDKEEHLIDLRTFEKNINQQLITDNQQQIISKVEKPPEIKKELPQVPLPSKENTEATLLTKSLVEAGPMILHKEIETKPTLGKQRSLGGLFGFLRAQRLGEAKIDKQKPVTAEVEIPILELPKPFDIARGKPSVVSKVELPKVVHYSDLKTSVIKPITDNLQPTTIKISEVSLPLAPKPFDMTQREKLESKSKIFESEIEKAKAAGLIINNQSRIAVPQSGTLRGTQPPISDQQFNIEEIPVEIEEIPRKSFFSKILQFFTGLFVTKKKIIKEVPEQKENLISKLAQERSRGEISMPLPPTPPAAKAESPKRGFEFPLEFKLPELKKNNQLPAVNNQQPITDNLQLKELEPPEVHEAREKQQPIMAKPEESKASDEEIIDLRTFQKIK